MIFRDAAALKHLKPKTTTVFFFRMPDVSAQVAEALVHCLKIELGDSLTDEVWESRSFLLFSASFSSREAHNFSVNSGATLRLVWDSWPSSAGSEGHLVRIQNGPLTARHRETTEPVSTSLAHSNVVDSW